MARSFFCPISSAILIVFALSLGGTNSAQSASAPPVAQALRQKAQNNGKVRVIVELAVSAAVQSPVDSDIIRSMRHAEVARARDSVRANLLGTKHTVLREYEQLPYLAVEVDADGHQTLESLHGLVVQVVEDSLNRPFLTQSVLVVQANQVWAGDFGGTPFTGNGTVVAILDSGVDKTHPFLAGKVVGEACFSSNNDDLGATSVCPGGATESFASGSGMPCNASLDGCDHGTHVAGIAAGKGQAFSGVARDAAIMAVQVFTRFDNPSMCGSDDPCILAFNSDVLAGLERVYARRTALNIASVNLSLGSGQNGSACDGDSRKPVIDLLRSAGIATVVASGNDGFTDAITAPACISSAISVGSTGDGSPGATLDIVSSFSNSDSILSLLAPGAMINSSVTPGNGFKNFQGTSMAAPHVAGAFALLKEAGPSLTVSQMLDSLQSTGVPVLDERNGITKPRIQIRDALFALPLADLTDPGKIADLKTGTVAQTNVTLNWTAPGDDDDAGAATVYDLRFSTTKFTDATWNTLTPVTGEPTPAEAGTGQNKTVTGLLCGRSYFFAIKARDEAGNESVLSNVATAKTAACNRLVVAPTRLSAAEQNVAYNSGAINITDGAPPYNLQIITNTSADISYDPASRAFKGTPTAPGSFRISGIAKDAVGSEKKVSFLGKIARPVQITTKILRDGKVNVPYKAMFRAKAGVKAYEWEVIPSGLVKGSFAYDKATGRTSLLATEKGIVDLNVKVKSLAGGTATSLLQVEFK
jgi:subtilisin family serine protease